MVGPVRSGAGAWKPDGESVRLLQHVITTLYLQRVQTGTDEDVAGPQRQGRGGLGLGGTGVGGDGGGAGAEGLAAAVLAQGSGGMFGRQRMREAQLARLCDEVVQLRAMVGGLLEVQREQQRLLEQLLIQGAGVQQGAGLQEQEQDRGVLRGQGQGQGAASLRAKARVGELAEDGM